MGVLVLLTSWSAIVVYVVAGVIATVLTGRE
jgi:hypothetical protein